MVPVAAAALVGAGALVRPPMLAAAEPPWVPPACADAGPPGPGVGASPGAWYRTEGLLDGRGSLAATSVTLGAIGGVTHRLVLPAESFASGPVGGVVLVGADDGVRSRVALVDVARGCATPLTGEAAVVRSALLEPGGASVLEHRVDRVTREDLGVWRVPVDGSRARRLVGAPPADWRYGRTFTTELFPMADGRLAVTSCGVDACRTRIVREGRSRVDWVGPTGPVVGVTPDGGVVAWAACPGSPCAVLRFGTDGDVRMLVAAAVRAAVDGRTLVAGTAHGLVAVDLVDGSTRTLEDTGLVPLGGGSMAAAGATHPGSSVLLAPGGRMDASSARVAPATGSDLPALVELAR